MNWEAVTHKLLDEAKDAYEKANALTHEYNDINVIQALTKMATADTLRALALALKEGLDK